MNNLKAKRNINNWDKLTLNLVVEDNLPHNEFALCVLAGFSLSLVCLHVFQLEDD